MLQKPLESRHLFFLVLLPPPPPFASGKMKHGMLYLGLGNIQTPATGALTGYTCQAS